MTSMKRSSDRILLGTRKGTFAIDRGAERQWRPSLLAHAGVGVNFVVSDPHTSTLWAALGHGHWGAKLSRSADGGKTWHDAAQIAYPEGARYLDVAPGADPSQSQASFKAAKLQKLWSIAFGPAGRMYVGTIPGGLFVSEDGGDSFALNLPLWNHESRGGDLF